MKSQISAWIWGVVIGCIFMALSLHAELTVVSTSPANGAVSVNTVMTVEIVFSEPLDTTTWYETMGFFLSVKISPDSLVGDPESMTISPDLKIVRAYNLRLAPNTRYVLAVLGAKSVSGEHLKKPAIVTFTTGPSLPTGKIEGNVSFSSGNPEGTLIGVFTTLFSDEFPIAAGVADATGHYAIPYVPEGMYWIAGIQDLNHTGNIKPEPEIDPVGLYDADGDGLADRLLLTEGETRTNVNLTLSFIQPMTAKARFSQIQSIVSTFSMDAVLVALLSTGNISL